ncbi:type II CRISPR RNA-guided endonuclease Cas9 [Pseudothauera rhizosphaerae]|uniref:CRISPR-associated endonuclease Cas9 n=1 Tax=Pseudothauera rhizosphaerae TaxID=2565932 RepID=A0A4V3WAS4_9RHOO|nr:type II CRISPR RNA-guided endonuclease Cas9 [Pseudothauera rhizosphaerae]THF60401.1 type II CRISPR RNA-guided endonuclease Cas9 [Pseudothauera rhizosphaerae]
MVDKTLGPLTFGFDIGIASVGWCVLAENRIIDLGVRCFDKAETAKEGESLNLARRTARLMRRRLRRRAWRLIKLARLLRHTGLVADTDQLHQPSAVSPWRLRVEGLDRRLTDGEWACVIYHICKHRGFHWISRAEERKAEGDAKGEGGRVKKGLADTQRRMQEKGYRSAAEMVLAEFPDTQRNKQGDYSKALSRILLGEELARLFKRQHELGNTHADAGLEAKILGVGDRKSGLFWEQKPPLAGVDLLKMLGKCTFEKDEYRAPKASFTAERHVWLTRLSNLRIIIDGATRPLDEEERRAALPLPYKQASDLTYKQLRVALTKAGLLPDSFRFAGLNYPYGKQPDEAKVKDPETEKLIKLPAWQELRKTLKDKGLETEWEGMAGAATGGDPTLLDEVARVLSVYKDGDEVTAELRKLPLPGGERMIDALSEISFDKFHALSLKALRRIVPHMEAGLRYDEACAAAGYHHSQLHAAGGGEQTYLPPLYSGRDKDGRMVFKEDLDIPRNPVVLRSLNQARKVLNALVRAYGSPAAVHIEMARDLSRPLDERNKVKKAQDEYRERNEKDKAAFAAEFDMPAKSREFERFQLYREQQGKCAYSLKPLDLNRVLRDIGYAEVDHALPYSRSYDDSKNNKVLVLTEENRNKGNRTAYEYLSSFPGGEDGERWHNFKIWVESNKSYRQAKKTRLLRKDFGDKAAEEFRERNLNDTRYICRFFTNYVERHLKMAAGDDGTAAKRCVVLNGQATAFLRARWGLSKVRGGSDRHHALDSAVVAACSHGMIKRLGDYARTRELEKVRDGFPDPETGEIVDPAKYQQLHTHFPDPWPHFRSELKIRLGVDDENELRERLAMFDTYPPEALAAVRPLFVSRAPQRRNGGAAHKDTIYAQPERLKPQGSVTQKVPLSSLALKDMEKLIDPHRNEKLYAAIRARLEAHGGKGDRAFPPDNPLCKPDRDGNPTGPIVRTVTMVIDKLSGIQIRSGIAKNDSMLRVDVFRSRKDGKFHLVPVYVHHAVARALPNRAIVAFKDEDEWTVMNGDFDFHFSVHPNDMLRITLKKEKHLGYFASCNRSTGAFNLWLHDRNSREGKGGMIESIGIKTAVAVEKFHVDVLGNIYPAQPETRRGLA